VTRSFRSGGPHRRARVHLGSAHARFRKRSRPPHRLQEDARGCESGTGSCRRRRVQPCT